MPRKSFNTYMTEGLRLKIKEDASNGKTIEQISKWYGVCRNHVSYAIKSNSMAEYHELRNKANRKKKDAGKQVKAEYAKPEDAKPEKQENSKTVVVSYDLTVGMAKQLQSILNEQEIQSTSLTEILGELIEIKSILKKYMEV